MGCIVLRDCRPGMIQLIQADWSQRSASYLQELRTYKYKGDDTQLGGHTEILIYCGLERLYAHGPDAQRVGENGRVLGRRGYGRVPERLSGSSLFEVLVLMATFTVKARHASRWRLRVSK